MTLDAAFFTTLAAYTDAPPSWVLLVLDSESGLDPTARNSLGYSGLNQINTPYLQAKGIDPADYVTWPASKQLSQIVLPFISSQLSYLKPTVIQSPGGLYGVNFLPGRVKANGTDPTSVLATKGAGDNFYEKNAGLDANHDGVITIGDLDTKLYVLSKTQGYKNALISLQAADASVASPYDVPPLDPSVSEARAGELLRGLLIGGALVGAGAVALHAYRASKNSGNHKFHKFHKFHPGLFSNPIPKLTKKQALYLGGATAIAGIAGAAYLLSLSTTEAKTEVNLPPATSNPQLPTTPGLKVFPIVDAPGANIHFWDDWHQPRSGHLHQGNDLFATKGSSIVAPDDGKVTFTNDGIGGGLSFHFTGTDGTFYFGTHLDSFVGGNLGDSLTVSAGDEIGKVGTSGNATGTPPHLHFEIHPQSGAAIDPYPILKAAPRLSTPIGIAAAPQDYSQGYRLLNA